MFVATQPNSQLFNPAPAASTFSITGFDPGSANISLFGNGFTLSNFAMQAIHDHPLHLLELPLDRALQLLLRHLAASAARSAGLFREP